ncbi:DnaJ-like subfamily C member 3 [Lamellibrachia satsuma]|nr:DnaJ-like subfamily C member 3 [Lamellibrachia satsuma]
MNFAGQVGPAGMRGGTGLSALLIVAWTSMMKGALCSSKEETERHLEMGKRMLSAGQLADALSHYHAAVEGDPENYLTYFRRATVFMAMGKSKSALPDLDKILEIRPDFVAARLQRGSIKLKQGKLDDAKVDFEYIVLRDASNSEAAQSLDLLEPLQAQRHQAQELIDQNQHQEAIDVLTHVIENSPWDPELREMRAECYIAQGDYFRAVGDIRPTTKLRNDNTDGYYKLSTLYYMMGEADESLNEIRECLKLNPDHKVCHTHYRKVKKLVKLMQATREHINREQWMNCIDKAKQMLKVEPDEFQYVHRANGHICHCYSKAGEIKQAFDACNAVLHTDENNIDALCDRAETYITNDQFEEAVKDYQKAEEVGGGLNRVQEGLHRAQKLLKQSKKRDYYKILGVRRNAKKSEIIRAYRKLAVKWHPDKYDEGNKKRAEQMFIDIAAAKEVLSDPEKRRRYDQGEDPLDPEQQGGGGHDGPFWNQGFNPFGQSSFKFHFN